MSLTKKILVTGGCGFIGSHFVRHVLNNPEVEVLNIDVLTYAGNPDNLLDVVEEAGSRYRHIKEDIVNSAAINDIVREYKPDVVVHFAAESHVDRSYFDVSDFIRSNVEGTRVVLEAVRKNCPEVRFVHISTDEIYGDVESDTFSKEDSPIRPSNLYAASKASADLLVQAFIRTYDFPAIIVRGSNNYGTHQYPEKLIPMVITNLKEGRIVSLHGDGSHQRSWLNVLDFCSAIDLVLNKADTGTIWNVSGEIKTNMDVIETIAQAMGINHSTFIERVPDRPGADFRYAPSSDKLKNELDWKPVHNFDSSIKDIIKWYEDNGEWLNKIHNSNSFTEHITKQASGSWF